MTMAGCAGQSCDKLSTCSNKRLRADVTRRSWDDSTVRGHIAMWPDDVDDLVQSCT